MSKADDLRKKMEQRSTIAVFTPRPSVNVQPIPQTTETKPEATPRTPKAATPMKTPQPVKKAEPEVQSDKGELVALFAKVPKEDKRWLDHYRIDEGKDLGELVSEAINLLRKQAGK